MDISSNLGVVVTIHDQELLIAYEAERKFAELNAPLTYVFVGHGPTDMVAELPNVIIARDLEENIETHKYLVDFTCWYALVQNKIPSCEFLALIQYDVSIAPNFVEKSIACLQNAPQTVLGYVPLSMNDRNFIRDNMGSEPLNEACRVVYGVDIHRLLKSHISLSEDKLWPTTNNVAMHRETLKDFVRWFTPLAMHMGNQKPAGHAFERAIKLYSILSGRANSYVDDVLSHYQLNSHETQDFKKDTGRLSQLLARNVMSRR
ncbi:hypothetical protein ACM25N_07745 [Roseovarius sp. C7]|uniref:hypothetical protein n=1 Tax=Roseovarius sp. C7 TaxID=3398643 RepID=UPI0039F6EFF4